MNMKVDLCGVTLNNPVMTASGTFGAGEEYSEFVDLNRLGAVVTKGVANVPWEGNPTPRVAEVYDVGIHRSCGQTCRPAGRSFRDQYFLSECKRGRNCLWTESKDG